MEWAIKTLTHTNERIVMVNSSSVNFRFQEYKRKISQNFDNSLEMGKEEIFINEE